MHSEDTRKDNFREQESEIDIKEILYIFLSKWYWFVISAVILTTAGYIYLKRQAPVYETQMSVLIKQEKNAPEEMLLLQDLGLTSGKNNIDNEAGVFKSPDLMTNIVSSLELNTTYTRVSRFGFYSPELYKSSPLYVRLENIRPDSISAPLDIVFVKESKGYKAELTFFDGSNPITENKTISQLPGYIESSKGKIYVAEQKGVEFGSSPLKVSIRNAGVVARNISRQLSITPSTKQSSLLEITLKCENRRKGEDILQALHAEYNKDAIADKNMVAYNTAVFIEERLKDLAKELGEVEVQVESYRKENQITDIPTQASAYLSRNEGYEKRRMEIETQLNLVKYIQTFISKPENKDKLIPNLGLNDQGLIEVIGKYNEILIKKEQIASSSSENNPAFKTIKKQVESMHENISASLANERKASEIAIRDLDREFTSTNSKIRNIPTIEREYSDILRQQNVKSNLFVYLLQKREETNLTQAGVAPKAKMIAKPFSGANPVAPKKSMILFAFFIIGLIIPGIIIFLIDYFQTKIDGAKDLQKLKGIGVIGDISKVDTTNASNGVVVVKRDDDSVMTEMFRTLRNNLLFMIGEKDQNVILVTSTVPKEGKTFISANLAMSISLMDKTVLVVGGDLRNPQIFSALGFSRWEKGVSSILAGLDEDYKSLVHEVDKNLYILPAGPIPPNPNELLSKPRLKELIETVKKDYDYIIIDSAPLGVVTDTLMLSKYADATLYVVREGYSEKDTVLFINNLVEDNRIHNAAVVLNQASEGGSSGRYKYGYKYAYSYRYRYGYVRGYGENKKPS